MTDWISELCRSFAKRLVQEAAMTDFQGPNMSQSWLDDVGTRLEQIKREELAAVPSYCERFAKPLVIMLDPIIHTDEHPYCGDETCPCMAELYAEVERREQEPRDCFEGTEMQDDAPWLSRDF